jgi:segregation and condensation protein A
VTAWSKTVESDAAGEELDCDRVGVFWALLFLSSQGKVELEQKGGLFGPLRLRHLGGREEELPRIPLPDQGSAGGPARDLMAA